MAGSKIVKLTTVQRDGRVRMKRNPRYPRTWKKKDRNSKGSFGLPQSMTGKTPFPPSMLVKMPYVDNFTNLLSDTVSGDYFGTEAVFRLNSLYDPNFTASGHQPYGRDVFAQVYNKYKVYGVKVDARWSDPGADGALCGIMLSTATDTTTLTGLSASSAVEKPSVQTVCINNTGSQYKRWSKYISIAKLEGLTKAQFNGDFSQYSSAMGVDPLLTPWLRVAVANMSGTVGVKCNLNLRLTYYVKLFDRKIMPQS